MHRRRTRSELGCWLALGLGLGLGVLTACGEAPPVSGYGLRPIELRMTGEALGELRHGTYTETTVPCQAKIEEAASRCRISVAGATTRDDLKKNFDLELASAYAGRYRYRLSAMSGDPSGLRALLAFASFEMAGLRVPRVEPVALWMNDEYLGLYLLLEPIDPAFFEQRGDRIHALYKARNLQATLESTQNIEEAFAERVDQANYGDVFVLIEDIQHAARGEPHRLDDLVDRSEVLRYMAASQFVDNWDGIFNNYFLARSEQEPLFSILAWDLDQTFENVLSPTDGALFETNALFRFLYAEERARYLEEIRRLDQLVPPDVFAHWVDEFSSRIGEAYQNDRFLNEGSLHEQGEALKRRAQRQHEVVSDP